MPVAVLDSGATLGAGGVQWLYGLQEQDSATTASDVSGGPGRPRLTQEQTGSGGEIEAGVAGIMPEGVARYFAPASSGNGLTLTNNVHTYLGGVWSTWCQFAWSGGTGVQLMDVGNGVIVVEATPTAVTADVVTDSGTVALSVSAVTNDNQPHFVVVVSDSAADTITLYVDDATDSDTWGRTWTVNGLEVGGTTSANAHQVAWVGFSSVAFDADRVAELTSMAIGGAERSDLRVTRFMRWLGVESLLTAEVGLSDVGAQNVGGSQVLDLVAGVNDVEQGVLFATGDGRLMFHSRSHRRGLTGPAWTVAASDVDPDGFEVAVDMSRVVNDVYLAGGGGTARVVNDDSVALYGRRTDPRESIPASSPDTLQAAAEYTAYTQGYPRPRASRLTFDLFPRSAEFCEQVMLLEVGDLIQVTGLPDQAPASTLDLFIEGFDEEITHDSWQVTLITSPAFDESSQLDTATAVLDSTAVLTY